MTDTYHITVAFPDSDDSLGVTGAYAACVSIEDMDNVMSTQITATLPYESDERFTAPADNSG